MKTKRSYTMGARAEAVEETRRRIVRAMFELGSERLIVDISLDDVARKAGVSVQTVLRQFGTRAGVVAATTEFAQAEIAEERATPVGDVDAAMRVLVEHYEQRGQIVLLMLTQERSDEQLATLTTQGRRLHRTWVEQVFAPWHRGDDALVDLLVVATDVYTWKLLRVDRGLSRSATQKRMTALVRALLATTSQKEDPA